MKGKGKPDTTAQFAIRVSQIGSQSELFPVARHVN